MSSQSMDGWESAALTLASVTIAGLVLAEQFRTLPAALVAHGAAWWIGRRATAPQPPPAGATG